MYKICFYCMYMCSVFDITEHIMDSVSSKHSASIDNVRYSCRITNTMTRHRHNVFHDQLQYVEVIVLKNDMSTRKRYLFAEQQDWNTIGILLNNQEKLSLETILFFFDPMILSKFIPIHILGKLYRGPEEEISERKYPRLMNELAYLIDDQAYDNMIFHTSDNISKIASQITIENVSSPQNKPIERKPISVNRTPMHYVDMFDSQYFDTYSSLSENEEQYISDQDNNSISCIEIDCTKAREEYIEQILQNKNLIKCFKKIVRLRIYVDESNQQIYNIVRDRKNMKDFLNNIRYILESMRGIIQQLNCQESVRSIFFRKILAKLQALCVIKHHMYELSEDQDSDDIGMKTIIIPLEIFLDIF